MRRYADDLALDELTDAVLAALDSESAVPAMRECAHRTLLAVSHCHLSSLLTLTVRERAASVDLFPDPRLNDVMAMMSSRHAMEHPLLRHHVVTADVAIHTPGDVSPGWRSSWTFAYLRATAGVTEHIVVPVDFAPGLRVSFALGRDGRAFDDAERDALVRAQHVLRIGARAVRVAASARSRLEEQLDADGAEQPLTRREREVLGALASGRARRVVARELGISVRTLDKHVEHVNTKLGTASLLQSLEACSRARVATTL